MAKKKTFLDSLLADRAKAKRQRERDRLAAEQAERKAARAFAAQNAKDVRAEERRVAAKEKETARLAALKAKQAQQLAAVKAKAAERQSAQKAAERARAATAARTQQAKQDLVDGAAAQSAEISARLSDYAGMLSACSLGKTGAQPTAERIFNSDGGPKFSAFVAAELMTTEFPKGLPRRVVAEYNPELRELMIDCELPGQKAVPVVAEYRVSRGEIKPVPRREAETKKLYSQLLARVILRTIHEAFSFTPATLVDSILLNAHMSTVDPATGLDARPCLVNVQVQRVDFESLQLTRPELDPEACLRGQNSVLSANPYDLQAVKPLLFYGKDGYKTIAGVDLAINLDSRIDLLSLTPNEFENLVKQLFEAQGMKAWQTQQSNDEGVDAIVVNEDPVMGGLVIVQAKRYSKCVNAESVSALIGDVGLKNATRGILVTTSWAGKSSHEKAKAIGGRLQIIEGRELKSLFRKHMNIDVLISLPKLGPGWERNEVS